MTDGVLPAVIVGFKIRESLPSRKKEINEIVKSGAYMNDVHEERRRKEKCSSAYISPSFFMEMYIFSNVLTGVAKATDWGVKINGAHLPLVFRRRMYLTPYSAAAVVVVVGARSFDVDAPILN